MFAIISPFTQSFDDIWFTYKVPQTFEESLKTWNVVKIPFWKKEVFWLVLEINANTDFDKLKIKEIIDIYSNDVFLSNNQIITLKSISKTYFSLIHQSLSLFFPKNLVWKINKNKFFLKKDFLPLNYTFDYKKSLNKPQKQIFENIISSSKNKFLLYWVTWSWKTEIYINLIKHYLDLDKQSLLLVPEIILTNQIFERIKKVFWKEVIILNSTISDAKKTTYWEQIYKNQAKVIIWTRSALFYPYNNLWIIIVDEEHDNSYISDISPRYDCIEVALKINDLEQNKILLWSWTPKINHMYRWLKWEFEVLNLLASYEK